MERPRARGDRLPIERRRARGDRLSPPLRCVHFTTSFAVSECARTTGSRPPGAGRWPRHGKPSRDRCVPQRVMDGDGGTPACAAGLAGGDTQAAGLTCGPCRPCASRRPCRPRARGWTCMRAVQAGTSNDTERARACRAGRARQVACTSLPCRPCRRCARGWRRMECGDTQAAGLFVEGGQEMGGRGQETGAGATRWEPGRCVRPAATCCSKTSVCAAAERGV
jgi:hypothetical protein